MNCYMCAMCGDSAGIGAPEHGIKLPSFLIKAMDGGDGVDTASIIDKVTVDLCGDCYTIAQKMVRDHDTSPIPEFQARHVRYDETGKIAVMGQVSPEEIRNEDLADEMIQGAHLTLKMVESGDAEHMMDSRIFGAEVLIQAMKKLRTRRNHQDG